MRLVLEFLHKCTECEVRNLFAPKFFHSAQVSSKNKISKFRHKSMPVSNGGLFSDSRLFMDTGRSCVGVLVVRPFDLRLDNQEQEYAERTLQLLGIGDFTIIFSERFYRLVTWTCLISPCISRSTNVHLIGF